MELPKHQASKFRWRTAENETPVEVFLPGAQTSFTVPAGTFPCGGIQWQALVQASNGVWSSDAAWNYLTVISDRPTPVIVSPSGTYVNGKTALPFTWKYGASNGFVQSQAELQYSLDSLNYSGLAVVKGTALSCSAAANTLPSGRLWWRLRSFNQNGQASPWSQPAEIVVYGSSPVPRILSVSNHSRPVAAWTSIGQVAAAVKAEDAQGRLVFQAEEIAGSRQDYRIPQFLANGQYKFSVRVKNAGGVWSGWAVKSAQISVSAPEVPRIKAAGIKNGVRIEAPQQSNAVMYVLRDQVPIGKLSNGAYDDFGAVGVHSYMVRAVSSGGGFSDSETVKFETVVSGPVLAPCCALAEMIEVDASLDEAASVYRGSLDTRGEELYFTGRSYPVFVFGGSVSRRHSISFATYSPPVFRRVFEFAESRQPMLYRDHLGNRCHAIILTDSFSGGAAAMTHSMELACVDYSERIEYD